MTLWIGEGEKSIRLSEAALDSVAIIEMIGFSANHFCFLRRRHLNAVLIASAGWLY